MSEKNAPKVGRYLWKLLCDLCPRKLWEVQIIGQFDDHFIVKKYNCTFR
jgi:hypothetical protein